MLCWRKFVLSSSALIAFSLLLNACANAPAQAAVQTPPNPLQPPETPVLARTPIGEWLLLEFKGGPNDLAWVFTKVVALNVDIIKVPVIAPAPTATLTQ